jgi:trigger factor
MSNDNVSQFRKGFRQAPQPTKGQVMQENATIAQKHESILQRQGQMIMSLLQGHSRLQQEVTQNLGQIQEWEASVATTEASKAGDNVLMDYAGVLLKEDGSMEELAPGVPALFDGGNSELFILNGLGTGKMIAGFEDALIGRKAGEEIEVTVQFPENYPEHLKSRKAKFYLHIHEVRTPYKTSVVGELIKQHNRLKAELQAKAAAEAAAKAKEAEEAAKQAEASPESTSQA